MPDSAVGRKIEKANRAQEASNKREDDAAALHGPKGENPAVILDFERGFKAQSIQNQKKQTPKPLALMIFTQRLAERIRLSCVLCNRQNRELQDIFQVIQRLFSARTCLCCLTVLYQAS